MMQFVVIAQDGTDAEAPARRRAVREAHLDLARRMKARGELIAGGALLNDEDEMIGSVLIVEFASREALQAWLDVDPYVTGGVWQHVDVRPFRLALARGGG